MEMARRNNCNVLRGRLDFNCLDDSFDDPDYCVKKNEDTSKDSDDVYSFGEEEFFNPFEENDSNNSFVNLTHLRKICQMDHVKRQLSWQKTLIHLQLVLQPVTIKMRKR